MSIHKLPSGSWRVMWRNPFTRKQEGETFKTRQEAKKKDAHIKYQLEYERETFRRPEEEKKPEVVQTFDSVFFIYLKEKVFTQKALAWQMDCLKTARKFIGGMPIEEISKRHIVQVLEAEKNKGVKGVTVRSRLKALRTVLRWAVGKDLLKEVPAFPELPPVRYEKFVPPTAEEIERLLHHAPEHLQKVIILGAFFGMRVGQCELFKLRWKDVDLFRKVIRVQAAKKNQSEPWREIPIKDSLLGLLRAWKEEAEERGEEYCVMWDDKPITTIKRSWKTALKNAGIRYCRPYDLRHFFGTELLAGGTDIGTATQLMGHSSPTMLLKHYQHVLTKQKKKAIESLPVLHEECYTKEKGATPLQ